MAPGPPAIPVFYFLLGPEARIIKFVEMTSTVNYLAGGTRNARV